MSNLRVQSPAPDQALREQALDPCCSILVQAPAGSGKTTLLSERFLRLLCEVDEPGQVVAITFTNAAAAEMRNRILDALRKAEPGSVAHRALLHSERLGWKLLDLPAQLRIKTIDSFCRDLALQQPLLTGLGGGIDISEQPDELYRRAARETLQKIDEADSALSAAIECLLLWRDNGWQELENLLVAMLKSRDRWMHGFVLKHEQDWTALRERLEQPFAQAVRDGLIDLSRLLDQVPGARKEALELARFACEEPGDKSPMDLAKYADFPSSPFPDGIISSRDFFIALSGFLQTQIGGWRSEKGLKTSDGFPSTPRGRAGKARFAALIAALNAVPGLEAALAAVRALPSVRYTDEEWKIVRACFTLLRYSAGQLQIAFAEAGRVDFIEVAQIAQRVLRGDDNLPTDAALAVSDGIRHLLVDEFQDTSRRQHQLLSSLVAAWPERAGRTGFVVGDPMQSIYFFREADAELFPRVQAMGLEVPHDEPLHFDFVPLKANFRSTPKLVNRLNRDFEQIFATGDGSGITFFPAEPARSELDRRSAPFTLHLDFVLNAGGAKSADAALDAEAARNRQIQKMVALIRSHMDSIEQARASGEKFRIAVLGRAKTHLVPVATALREAGIPFRAVELEKLAARPEVLDALALARALLNPEDRIAWLGVLRAPWCGLALDDLHTLAGSDDPLARPRPVPELLAERLPLLSEEGQKAAGRVLDLIASASALRAAQPTASPGTWLEQLWLQLGGAECVDATACANLNLLWSCLDQLPGGESDLLGAGLNAALNNLTALPDAEVSSECGVQLMTIHKSKGLEFEVVLVPELQAHIKGSSQKMLSWLERGLPRPDASGEITEFLIAPIQPKRADKGQAKQWVDRVYSARESQETRRILYVAATRAREELHLFARPSYKDKDGKITLVDPSNSLLATAWPALAEEVARRFDKWKASKTAERLESQQIESIAASGETNLLVMPAPMKPALLRRLPPNYRSEQSGLSLHAFMESSIAGLGSSLGHLFPRHEGGLLSRALGTAVHSLLEELARLRAMLEWDAARSSMLRIEPKITAQVRAIGLGQAHAARIALEAIQIALLASHDPVGSWILSPHANAASEASWVGVASGQLRTVRVDRVFQAGPTPGAEGNQCWWIIDYKTAHAGNLDPVLALPELRKLFSPQILAYAELLSHLHANDGSACSIRAGLYYPRMSLLDWWEV